MAVQIQLRRDLASAWSSVNPILADGEIGLETNTGKLKIGNGTTRWNSLDYFSGSGSATSVSSLITRNQFTATEGQSSFTVTNYDVSTSFVNVYVEGIKLDPTSYTLSSATSITLSYALDAGAAVTIEIFR